MMKCLYLQTAIMSELEKTEKISGILTLPAQAAKTNTKAHAGTH